MGELKLESAPTLLELDDEFLDNFTSLHTRKSYQNDILAFLEFACREFRVTSYAQITRQIIIKYRNMLAEVGGHNGEASAPKTIGRKLASLSSYFDYLVERRICEFNPVSSVKRPRRVVMTPTRALSADQVRELMQTARAHPKCGPLHYALMVTFFTTGLRKSEILNLRVMDYKNYGEHKILEYRAKGGKLGQKLLHPLCVEALDTYMQWMKDQEREHIQKDWLFQPTRNPKDPTNLNKPINPRTINEMIAKYALKIGLNFPVTPHSARATFISELLNLGVDIYRVATEVGHASVTTTGEYDKRRKELADSPVTKLRY